LIDGRINEIFSFSLILIIIGAIPIGIQAFNYMNSASLQWPMIWLNEATIWGCIFPIFPIVGVSMGFVNDIVNSGFTRSPENKKRS
jgi:hypothetical protein